MRGVIFILLWLSSLFGEIQINQTFKTLEVFLPAHQAPKMIQNNSPLTLLFEENLPPFSQILLPPFEKIEILPLSAQQTQLRLWGNNLSFHSFVNAEGTKLVFESEIASISWGQYFLVLGILVVLGGILLVFKKKLLRRFKPSIYQEKFLSPKAKLITLEHEEHIYVIFSNEKGNLLLNHYPKTKHNKDFTQLINED